ncbi:hypothetical protein ADK57_11040 [Streptomyces sp. MMG1533]|uniref:hypothetical protein n=1 Tax=Streptomyces sp. MMG1533 TaxID=1415546 RepID=UPI0006AE641D|nr:hypothetical protein [Streptomyces sp. MMG1533]KOU71547.1 hypothetical protein ADK57_11040 [Streptomyces sp. MMG1533]
MGIRTPFVAAVTVVLATGPLAGAAHARADLNCSDFAFQEDAQAEFNRNPLDPNRLDEDQGPDDGIACEVLPRRGSTGVTAATPLPTRGVQGGVGGSAGPADFEQALGMGLALGALALTAAHVALRRRDAAGSRRN